MGFISDCLNKALTPERIDEMNKFAELNSILTIYRCTGILQIPEYINTFNLFNDFCNNIFKTEEDYSNYTIKIKSDLINLIESSINKMYPDSLDKYIAVKYPNIKLNTY